jgi:hypothetical protein
MDPDETSMSGPRPPKAAPTAAPTDAELSRIAREAVHQPADPRLDRHLARLGAVGASETVDAERGQSTSRPSASGAEVERLNGTIRRLEMVIMVLVVAVAILAVTAVVLLLVFLLR